MSIETEKLVSRAKRLITGLDLLSIPEVIKFEPRFSYGHLSKLAKWTHANSLPIYELPPLKSAFVPRECLELLIRYADGERKSLDIPLKVRRRIEELRGVLAALNLISSTELIKKTGVRSKWFWEFVRKNPDWFVVFKPAATTWMPGAWVQSFEEYVANWRQDLAVRRERRKHPKTPIYQPRTMSDWSVPSEDNPLIEFNLDKLRDLRKELRLKQHEVAAYVGMTRTTYLNVEKGKRPLRLKEVDRIEDFLRQHWNPEKHGYFTGFRR
jgi:DNA-binding XRE family transcriptional regulator/predicted DNA-binding transcriptional regulator AlpA